MPPLRSFFAHVALWAALTVAPAAVFGAGAAWSTAAEAAANPFRVEVEPVAALAPGAQARARVVVVVPEGFHVYRDMMSVTVLDAGGLTLGAADFPPGLSRPDPANPSAQREQYDTNVVIEIPVTASGAAGRRVAKLEVKYQGCKRSLCYMPATEVHELVVDVGAAVPAPAPAPRPAPSAADAGPAPSWRDGALVSGGVGGAPPAAAPGGDFPGLPESAVVRKVDSEGKAHPVVARLLADAAPAAPGAPLRLGVHLEMAPGWHTYWRSPGAIGLPTEISWQLPEGWSASPFRFPLPHRYDVQGLVSYGYEQEVMFFSEVTPPPAQAPGTVTVGAKVKWLVCEATCIPGEAQLQLPLEVGAAELPSAFAGRFDAAAAALPAASAPALTLTSALSVSALSPGQPFRAALHLTAAGALDLRAEAGTWPAFTPILPSSVFVSKIEARKVQDGLLVIIEGDALELDPLPVGEVIGGLVQVHVDGKPVVAELTAPLPWVAAGGATPVDSPLFSLAGAPFGASAGPEAAPAAPAGAAPAVAAAAPAAVSPTPEDASLPYMLLLAFIGGAILNVMPCVLPVLTLKLFSLVEQRDISAGDRQRAGLLYGAGVVASFVALALVVVIAKVAFGQSFGWGSQFQYPGYVLALTTIVFGFGLSLFGVFEVPAFGANQAAAASAKSGPLGYFLTGVFTTLLATPCSAPFLGSAMGFAFTLPPVGVVAFFVVAGAGLAAPFVLIAFVPALMRFLPRPGAWMETFKHVMGFSLMATTVWLLDVIGGLLGRDGLVGVLAFLTAVGVAAWAQGRFGGPIESGARQLGVLAAGLALSSLVAARFVSFELPAAPVATGPAPDAAALDYSAGVPWVPFSEENVQAYAGKVVFIDFTADWCLTCKVNEKTVIEQPGTREGMAALGVVPLKADWTRQDPTISAWLQRFGRAGVPFYLIIPKDPTKPPVPLGEVLTQDGLLDALRAAGA
jgi:thiol:disulfide interchange protein